VGISHAVTAGWAAAAGIVLRVEIAVGVWV
jgi:hypothetical protein